MEDIKSGFKIVVQLVLSTVTAPPKCFWPVVKLNGSCKILGSRIGGLCRVLLTTCFTRASCLDYSLTLKMEATCSSEISNDFQRAIRRYIPEDRTILNVTSPRASFVGLEGS
jgi:hypothetical protein